MYLMLYNTMSKNRAANDYIRSSTISNHLLGSCSRMHSDIMPCIMGHYNATEKHREDSTQIEELHT